MMGTNLKKVLKFFLLSLSGLLLTIIVVWSFFITEDAKLAKEAPKDINWGVTFSQKMSQNLGLNWKDNYLAIINDLHPAGLRLVAYWDSIEPQKGTWDFADLDWQVSEAERAGIPVTISIGQKAPRWPECHYPDWLNIANTSARQSELLVYLRQVVNRYRERSSLKYWQVENEPFIKLIIITCPKTSYQFVEQEVKLVKSLDPIHQTILTDSGQVGSWYKAAKLADIFAITFYQRVYRPIVGQYNYPYLPGRFSFIRFLNHKPQQKSIVIELQAEPWNKKSIGEMTTEEQISSFSLADFRKVTAKAKSLGLDNYYFWGAEWWYSLKLKGIDDYWLMAKSYIDSRSGISRFPNNFLWGASTSAYQVEGGNYNDWSDWEQQNANRLATTAKDKYAKEIPNWASIEKEAIDPKNYLSGEAVDEYNRYAKDNGLAQSIGLNALRISLEWSRIEPQEGQFNQEEIDHYRSVIADIRKNGMEPVITLWHYTLPVWFADKGGWLSPTAEADFKAYVGRMVTTLGPDVNYWITLNEPGIYASNAYYLGTRPPAKRWVLDYFVVLKRLARVHQRTYSIIKSLYPSSQVGLASDYYSLEAIGSHWYNRVGAALVDWWRNHYFTDLVANQLDFLGVNYYIHYPIGTARQKETYLKDKPKSDLGWQLYPQGIYQVLLDLSHRYHKPIYITENGIADASDSQRRQYIKDILANVYRAISDGADVRGYFYWSLVDNFEWEKGFWPRFGLVSINYGSLARTIRPSTAVLSEIIKNNALIK